MVHLRASQINGCSLCVAMHASDLKKGGETDERLHTVAAWRQAPWFSEAERAALALTEAVTRLSDRADPVPDDVWAEATRHYDERALFALLLAISTINVWNRLNAATRPGGRVDQSLARSSPRPCTPGGDYPLLGTVSAVLTCIDKQEGGMHGRGASIF